MSPRWYYHFRSFIVGPLRTIVSRLRCWKIQQVVTVSLLLLLLKVTSLLGYFSIFDCTIHVFWEDKLLILSKYESWINRWINLKSFFSKAPFFLGFLPLALFPLPSIKHFWIISLYFFCLSPFSLPPPAPLSPPCILPCPNPPVLPYKSGQPRDIR